MAINLLYESDTGKIWHSPETDDYTTMGDTRKLACELATCYSRLMAQAHHLRVDLEGDALDVAAGEATEKSAKNLARKLLEFMGHNA